MILALDATLTAALKKFNATLAYDGGAGSNTLRGSNSTSTWNITGVNAGNLGTVSFTSVGNLSGGTGQDTFALSSNAGLTGSIDGGAGTDTLDWSAFTSSRQVTLTGLGSVNGLTGTEPSTAGGFTDMDSLAGGQGSDSITGLNAAATWQVGATDLYTSGKSLSFSGFENLVGGTASDTFQISGNRTANLSGGARPTPSSSPTGPGSLAGSTATAAPAPTPSTGPPTTRRDRCSSPLWGPSMASRARTLDQRRFH